MTYIALDNPLWASLTTSHRAVARGADGVLRYPRDVAPFLAVPDGRAVRDEVLDALIEPGETVLLVGPVPAVSGRWEVTSLGPILQMVCEGPIEAPGGPPIRTLGPADREAVLALTALVYPHYFRPRTMELGRYTGVVDGPRLEAMLGERMGFPGFREISAVCTHPDHVGRGLARHLLATASTELREAGTTPFLHVSPQNTRAVRLYEQNGYRTRTGIAFWSLARRA
ncbi:MAG: GNAT family N-acetyltransferase [Myxococcales bacterium]|nr:GNAT family N-acetyltransferase [Myxococcales bacterium]